jgi:uncharacterized Tic20 family protein
MYQAGSTSGASSTLLESIALRDGGSLDIWPDHLIANGRVYVMAELEGAVQSFDPAAPAGRRPLPAISLRGPDGAWRMYVPADPPDVQRALRVIYAARPDLSSASAPTVPSRSDTPLRSETGVSGDQAILAAVAHLSYFFAPFLLPLIIWVAAHGSSPFAARQAKQALFFHLMLAVVIAAIIVVLGVVFVALVLAGLSSGSAGVALPGVILVPVGALAIIALTLVGLGFAVYGAIEAFQGHQFSYPFLRRL